MLCLALLNRWGVIQVLFLFWERLSNNPDCKGWKDTKRNQIEISVLEGVLVESLILINPFSSFLTAGFCANRSILVLNKTDLLPQVQRQKLDSKLRRISGLPPVCLISCHTNEGVQDFLTVLHSSVKNL